MSTDSATRDPAPTRASTSGRRRRPRLRWRLLLVTGVVLAGIGILAVSGLQRSLVFYRTPTELVQQHSMVGDRVRLGGLVVPGSLRIHGQVADFSLTDGVTKVPVVYRGQLIGTFRQGQDALVDGTLGRDHHFHATLLMVKHSDSYRAPDGSRYKPPRIGGGPR